jgi:tetratricopeptide (TPR) repeat protein
MLPFAIGMNWFRHFFGSRAQTRPSSPVGVTAASEWKARGNVALASGELAEAARCYEQGVLADASDASLRLNLGFVLLEQSKFEMAAERLLQALALRRSGDDFLHEAHFLLGRAYVGLGRETQALRSFELALTLQPRFAEAIEEGIRVLSRLGRHDEAVEWARRLVLQNPSSAARITLAEELAFAKRAPEALDLLGQICAEEPTNTTASMARFNLLFRLARFEEALAEARRLLALTGPSAILVNVAAALGRLGRPEEALAAVDEVLSRDPTQPDAIANRAGLLSSLGRVDDAIECARNGLRLYPDHADLHWNLAVSLLLAGNFEEGWVEHEWRDRSGAPVGVSRELDAPRWEGESLEGRAILLYGEQGFGDYIQFVRFVPLIARNARAVYLEVPQPLGPLITGLPSNCTVLSRASARPPVDFHCPLMSVPAVLRITQATIPANVPYLRAESDRVQAWRAKLPKGRLNVGIAWSGKPTHFNDLNRSMTLAMFKDLSVETCQFLTVQPDMREADRRTMDAWPNVLDYGRELRDFGDTAALIDALDLLVSVDTSVAHLAGALAKPTWILLPHPPDWRWMLEREDTPWYPSARLYRQTAARTWPEVLARVRVDLLREAARVSPDAGGLHASLDPAR